MSARDTVVQADSVQLTVLYDNVSFRDECTTSWGYSCLVEIPGLVILFDTGENGSILMENMEILGVDPGDVDVIVLSHEHRDHTGGLAAFLDSNHDVRVFIPRSFGSEIRSLLRERGIEPVDVDGPADIAPGVLSCGVMGDAIPEQSIVIQSNRGPILIAGCAHPGIATIAAKAKALAGRDPLLVMGGWHLRGSSAARIEAIGETFDELGVRYIAPSHCTGEDVIGAFEARYGERFISSGVGRRVRGADLK